MSNAGHETKFGLLGDWNDDPSTPGRALAALSEQGVQTAFHLGHLTSMSVGALNRLCGVHNITLHLLPNGCGQAVAPAVEPTWVAEQVVIVPQGHRWSLNGFTFTTPGGHSRTGLADVVLCHEAPFTGASPAVESILSAERLLGDRRAAQSEQRRVAALWSDTGAALMVHAHYHRSSTHKITRDDGTSTTIVSLNADNAFGAIAILDLAQAQPRTHFVSRTNVRR